MPIRSERIYDDYEVVGDTTVRLAPRPPRASAGEDSTARAACHERQKPEKVSCRCDNGACRAIRVIIPTDTAALIASAALPPPFGAVNDTLISEGELRELTQGIGDLPQAPWQFRVRRPSWGLGRYNRVEGLALGAKGEIDLGRLKLGGAGYVATADGALDLQAGLLRATTGAEWRLTGYHRLAAVDPNAHSLSIGNSLGALVLGRDDGDYFRATGAELTVRPAVTLPQRFELRVYAEQQRLARKRTDFSFPHLLHDDHVFRPYITADSADQVGAALTLRAQRGIDPISTARAQAHGLLVPTSAARRSRLPSLHHRRFRRSSRGRVDAARAARHRSDLNGSRASARTSRSHICCTTITSSVPTSPPIPPIKSGPR